MEEELTRVLREAQQRHITLRPYGRHVALWSPNTHIPTRLRRAIRRYRKEILVMMARHSVETCPNPQLHKRWHTVFAGRQICSACSMTERGMRRAGAVESRHYDKIEKKSA